jgi:isoleucyl-tRNA synthetase
MKDDEILTPVMGDGRYAPSLPLFGGLSIWDANPKIVQALASAGRAVRRGPEVHAQLHALLAPQDAGDLRATTQWFAGMDEVPGYGGDRSPRTLREPRCAASRRRASSPPGARRGCTRMIANRPDWTLSRQRHWGVPMPFFLHKETGELHPRTLELLEEVAKRVEQGGIEAWQAARPEPNCSASEAAQYDKSRDTLDVWFDSGSTHQTVLRGSHPTRAAFPPTCTWRARTSTAAGSTRRCSAAAC